MNILVPHFHKGCIGIVKHILAQWARGMSETEEGEKREYEL